MQRHLPNQTPLRRLSLDIKLFTMQNRYSEDQLIEQFAIILLENMRWQHQN